ncbi:HD domain-containing phosphohydrolase [Chloroflexota bacterium]
MSESILIIDDEAVIRKILHTRLSEEGYRCEEAENASQALVKLSQNSVGLAILDIKMPGKSGVELLPELKAQYPDTMVIMATATADIQTAIHCMKTGAYDYFTKPFNLEEVTLCVDRALEQRRLILENEEYHQHLEERVEEQAQKIRNSFFSAITSLAFALEAKDKYTNGHSQRVSDIAVILARQMNLSEESIERIRLAGLVHDIGKIGISEVVLNKPGKLTHEEFLYMQEHSTIGERILAPVVDDEAFLKLVRNHHERCNGTGYPDQLKGTQMPLELIILTIADSYEAMTSNRPYRQAMSSEAACVEIENGKGTQFDPEVAGILIVFVRTGQLT